MFTVSCLARARALGLAALPFIAVLATGCSLDKQEAPGLSGPSGFSLSLSMVASPDVLVRDGQSQSAIRLTAQDYTGAAAAGQRLGLKADFGTLSSTDVTTDGTGTATVIYTAPAVGTGATMDTISVVPLSANLEQSSGTRTLRIALAGPSVPVPAFTFSPDSPSQHGLVSFDATNTTLEGTSCNGGCSYAWDFGDGSSSGASSSRLAQHRFASQGMFAVTLTVIGPGGVPASATRNVVVGSPIPLTAAITFSPANPKIGDVVRFDGTSSTTPDGVAITGYAWDLGNGDTANGASVSTTYNAVRTFTVRLTITDALGRTATATIAVNVTAP